MGVEFEVDRRSLDELNKKFRVLRYLYPEEFFKALVAILFDIKLIAQKKLKADKHIVTSRLRNSIYVKTPKQVFAKRSTNSLSYSFDGGSGNRDLDVRLDGAEGAVGTNVVYAKKIEDLDSYLEYAVNSVNMEKRWKQAAERAEKKAIKKTTGVIKSIIKGL